MTNEKVQIDYLHDTTYNNTALNAIGATTDTTLRTVTAHNDANCKYVRKFGIDKQAADITNAVINTPRSAGGNAWTFDFQGWNGTAWVSMGSVKDTGGASAAFVNGAAFAATKIKIVITPDAGDTITIANADTITLTTDAGAMTVLLSAVSSTLVQTWYLSATGSTYYDSNLMYGGYRHTPTGTAALPYFTITAALAALGGAFTIVTVLDSMTYDEELTISGAYTLQAALGQTPTITSGCGARVTREILHDGNNGDTAYVSKTGADAAGGGTWENPYLTIGYAYTNRGGRTYCNIKDSETYNETVTLAATFIIEPIYGMIPAWIYPSGTILSIGAQTVSGIIFSNSASGLGISTNGTISNCTLFDMPNAISYSTSITATITKNIINNCAVGLFFNAIGAGTLSITKNIFTSCQKCIDISVGTNIAGTVSNNIFNSSTVGCILFSVPTNLTATISNNIFYNSTDGIYINVGGTNSANYTYNIFYNNSVGVRNDGVTCTLSYNCFYLNISSISGIVTNNNAINSDPKFIDINSNNFAISADSPCYKANGSEADVGLLYGNVLISSSTVSINGFILNGNNQYLKSIYTTGATDYTGLTIKWCNIYEYNGIAIDCYSGANTDFSITNNKIYKNGNGIKFKRGGNTCKYNILYSNVIFGIWSDYTSTTIDHNVFYSNGYGIYIQSNTSVIVVSNNIFCNNSTYGIYSIPTIYISYCDITDAYNSTVIINPFNIYHNIIDNPLFVNITIGSEDFHIKTIFGGYLITSPCYLAASDDYDIGAYLVTYGVASDEWKTYQLAYNPISVSESYIAMSRTQFETAQGGTKQWQKSQRRMFNMKYGNMQYMNTTDRERLFYFASLVQSRENTLSDERTRFRLHFLPSQKELASTSAIIDSTVKTLFDAGGAYIEDNYKGFHLNIKYISGTTDMTTDGTLKTATVGTASWTTNQYAGYYLNIMIGTATYYFYILSNTGTVLTVSDPNGYLTDQVSISWSIVKGFKILSNTSNVFTLSDINNELISGTYDYFVDYIICRSLTPSISYAQPRYYRQQESWKMGSEISFIEE